MLLGVRICNYDVFDDNKCGLILEDFLDLNENKELTSRPLTNLAAFIGKNSTGKSSFIDALSFIKKSVTADVAVASTLNNRPGFSNLVIDKSKPSRFYMYFCLKPNIDSKKCYVEYDLEINTNNHGSPYVESERITLCSKNSDVYETTSVMDFHNGKGKILTSITDGKLNYEENEICDEHSCALKVFGSIKSYKILHALYREISRWFFCKFSTSSTPTYYLDGNAPGGHKHLNSTGSNVMNVLEYLKIENESKYDAIVDEITEKIPTMKRKANLSIRLEDSPSKLFVYLLLLRDQDPYSTIFMETPDNDLYHDMVDVLANEMRDFTLDNPFSQIVFTTHNPYIIETMAPKEIWLFKRSEYSDLDDITIKCVGTDPIIEAMFKEGVGMGAIWYGGHMDEE